MTTQDFSKRLVILARKDLLGWEAANTIAHIAASIGNRVGEDFGTGETFIAKDGKAFPRNMQYPIIIKRANSSEQLQNILAKVREGHFTHLAFTREMIESTDDAAIEQITLTKAGDEIELLGLGIFGPHEEMNTLTKKFGLWE